MTDFRNLDIPVEVSHIDRPPYTCVDPDAVTFVMLPWIEVYGVGLLFDFGSFPYRWVIFSQCGDRVVGQGEMVYGTTGGVQ